MKWYKLLFIIYEALCLALVNVHYCYSALTPTVSHSVWSLSLIAICFDILCLILFTDFVRAELKFEN